MRVHEGRAGMWLAQCWVSGVGLGGLKAMSLWDEELEASLSLVLLDRRHAPQRLWQCLNAHDSDTWGRIEFKLKVRQKEG